MATMKNINNGHLEQRLQMYNAWWGGEETQPTLTNVMVASIYKRNEKHKCRAITDPSRHLTVSTRQTQL